MPTTGWPHYDNDEIDAVVDVLRSGRVNYHTGTRCKAFEKQFASHCRSNFAIAVANGTLALELALRSLKAGVGDEVIVTPRSFIASASCVAMAGATPVFADVDLDSQNINADSIAPLVSERTKAILLVHLAGWPCEMDPILELADQHGLYVIEDCAQAHGATYRGRPVGGIGDIGAFSFCQDKILSTGGEGGMLTLKQESDYLAAWAYKDHGKFIGTSASLRDGAEPADWIHEDFGTNWRMTEMQAAIGTIQLGKLHDWKDKRQSNAARFCHNLREIGALRIPSPPDHIGHAYYKFYAFLRPEHLRSTWDRARIIAELNDRGIRCTTGTYGQLYNEKAFRKLRLKQTFPLPNALQLANTSLMLEVHPTLSTEDIDHASDIIRSVFDEAQGSR